MASVVLKSGKVLKNKKSEPNRWKKVKFFVKSDGLAYSYSKMGMTRTSKFNYEHVHDVVHSRSSTHPKVFTVHLDDNDPLALKAKDADEAEGWATLIRKQLKSRKPVPKSSNSPVKVKVKVKLDKAKKLRGVAKYGTPLELKNELARLHMLYQHDTTEYRRILSMANIAKNKGEAALHKSAEVGHALNCAVLVHYEADIFQLSKAGQSPGQLALEYEFGGIGHILTQRTTDAKTIGWELVREAFIDGEEGSRLRKLAGSGDNEGVLSLLSGVQKLFQVSGDGLVCSDMDLCKAPVVDGKSQKHSPSRTALEKAVENGHDKVVDTLLSWGAEPSAGNFQSAVKARLLKRQDELRPDLAAKRTLASSKKSEAVTKTEDRAVKVRSHQTTETVVIKASPLAVGTKRRPTTESTFPLPSGGPVLNETARRPPAKAAAVAQESGPSIRNPIVGADAVTNEKPVEREKSVEYEPDVAPSVEPPVCACCFAFLGSSETGGLEMN